MSGPHMAPYSRHVLICTGAYCCPANEGKALYRLLPTLLTRYGLLFGPDRVKRGETPCLGVCQQGPIVAIYPEGLWYHSVTPALLEEIVREHMLRSRPVEAHCFHDLSRQPGEAKEQTG